MAEFLTHHRKKLFIVFLISALLMVGLCAQLGFLMIARSDHYSKMADELHKRERTIKAARGEIVDRNFRALGVQCASMWTYTMQEYAPYHCGSHFLSLTCTPKKAASFIVADRKSVV